MPDHVYKILEVAGSSTESSDQAVRNALAKAAETVRNLRWFEVTETRGHIEDQKIAHWQVTVRIGFTLDG
ncbi:MAG: dodecin family protein [Phycisphaerales bacterium]